MKFINRYSPLQFTTLTAAFVLLCFQFSAQADDHHRGRNHYQLQNLVADQAGVASHTDPNLINPWGIAFNPNGPVWIANNGTGTSTLYDGTGAPLSLVVTIPPVPPDTHGNPTGIVFNSNKNDFNGASFIFATESGALAAWAPPSTDAVTVSTTAGAIYKGLALGGNGKGLALNRTAHFLYATDFHNAKVQVFDNAFNKLDLVDTTQPSCNFSDPRIPAGFAPFGIQNINGVLYVTYAKQDADKEDDVAGRGLGYVNVFDANGCLIRRFAARGHLNAPWGIALAPANFGAHSDQLLIANFGDGTINAFDVREGQFRGPLLNQSGGKISIDGLWGIAFGNGVLDQPTNTLFFTAGPYDETHGLYGKINAGE